MRWLVVFMIVLVSILMADFYAFEDGILFTKSVSDGWAVPNEVEVISVDSDWWRIEKPLNDWWKIVESSRLIYVGDKLEKGEYSILSRSPVVFKNLNMDECFIRINGVWFAFRCKTPGKSVLRVPSESMATLFASGGWKAIYRFDGLGLTFYAVVKTSVPVSGELYLVSGRYFEKKEENARLVYKSMPLEAPNAPRTEKFSERRVYDIGDVDIPSGENTIKVFEGRVFETEKVYFVSFYIGLSSGWTYPRFAVEMENTRSNGLGYPMPDGLVHVFKNDIPIGSFEFEGAPEGGKLRIIENSVTDMRVKQTVLSSKKGKDGYTKIIRIDYENYGEERTLTVKLYGRNLKYLSGDIEPVEVADDFIVLKIDARNGKGSVTLNLRSAW